MNYLNWLDLKSYQSDFAANTARFKIGLWARQTGKDHTATAEAVVDCLVHPGATWIIVAASERQAIESLAKAKEWAQILQFDIDEYLEAPASLTCSQARAASTEIKWENGSRLLALPANPSTIRGYSGNIILTEFAFHENPDSIWRAIYPSITNPLRGGVKKLRIISTPNGLNNKFAQLWHSSPNPNLNSNLNLTPDPNPSSSPALENAGAQPRSQILNSQFLIPNSPSSLFFRSRITIHDAIAAGLPLNAAELQAGLNDPEAWAQEYLCEFMDNSSVLLPYDLIETCESAFATELSNPQSLSASALPGGHRPELVAGIDFARKNHLTVCWILERLPASAHSSLITHDSSLVSSSLTQHSALRTQHCYLTREILCLRNLSTPEQLEILRPRLNLCRKICLDYTGLGIGFGDFLHRDLGSHKVDLCPFTSSFKAELFPRLAAAFESRSLLIPIARDIREDLHSIYRCTTNSGQVLYRAHSTPDGHADRTTALALALRAAQTAPAPALAKSIPRRSGRGFRSSRSYSPEPRTLAIIY